MSYEIPTKDKLWIQPNKGEQFGNLWATFNMDFDSELGKVKASRRTIIRTDSTDDTDLGVPWAFVRTSADGTDRWWAGCGSVLFKNTAGASPSSSAFVQDAIAVGDGTPTDLSATNSDMVEFNSTLVVSTSTDLHKLAGGSWDKSWWNTTLSQTALVSGPHPLHVSKKTNTLLIGDINLVHVIDKNSNVNNSRVILPTGFEIIWIRSSYDGVWIGARNKLMREAQAFFWDESSENYNRGYGLKDERTWAGIIDKGVPYTVNGVGQLLAYTGTGFEEVAVFPNFQQTGFIWDDTNSTLPLNRNGMEIIEGKIHINVSMLLKESGTNNILDNAPSGIWTYTPKQGLRHKYSLSLYKSSEIDYGAFVVTVAGALAATQSSQGLFLAGGSINSNATTTINGIFYRDTTTYTNTRGYFITSIFESSAFEDNFQDLLLTFKRFINSGDRIIVKYRTIKNPNYPIPSLATGRLAGTGTFTSTSVFTTTADLSNVSAGDEVTILKGRGQGGIYKISTISFSTPTYTVTLAEAITNASGTMVFTVNPWIEAATISTQGIERQAFDLDAIGTFIQLKVELRNVPGGVSNRSDTPVLEKIVVNSQAETIV